MRIVHLSPTFSDALIALAPQEQKQVLKAIKVLSQGLDTNALRRHKLERVRNAHLVSYSANMDLRLIAYEPNASDSYFVYVGHHDDAYAFSESRRVSVDETTGFLRFTFGTQYEVPEEAKGESTEEGLSSSKAQTNSLLDYLPPRVAEKTYLFDRYVDHELASRGFTPLYVSLLRRISDHNDIVFLLEHLPASVSDMLMALVEEPSVVQAPSTQAPPPAKPAATNDVLEVHTPVRTLRDESEVDAWQQELERALALDFPKWTVFLHPSQRKAVHAKSKGPLRITGGPGTGKTVVGLHRAAALLQAGFEKVYILTYVHALAENLKSLIEKILSPENVKRVECVTFHSFAKRQIDEVRGGSCSLLWDKEGFLKHIPTALLQERFPSLSFLEAQGLVWEEAINIVAPQNIRDLSAYLSAPRPGAKSLTLEEKKSLWELLDLAFESMRKRNEYSGEMLSYMALRDATALTEKTAIVVDEVQDLRANDLRFLGFLCPGANQLTLLEDSKQRIYGSGYSLKKLGIAVGGRRSIHLFLNYRTTEPIGNLATCFQAQKGGSRIEFPVSVRTGCEPLIRRFDSAEAEQDFIADEVSRLLKENRHFPVAVLAQKKEFLDALESCFDDRGIEVTRISREFDLEQLRGVVLGTMHAAKGMEFSTVFVAGVGRGFVAAPANVEAQTKAANLLYVAMTRARDQLYVSGKACEALQDIEQAQLRAQQPRT
ncbi:MAG: DEAD/DEAH box helicase [Rhodocyclaceae bacterium]|jgi:hypothetical protein|nr:DEAD/DEAH box helicase [Rhodocyclaceae bacterium]